MKIKDKASTVLKTVKRLMFDHNVPLSFHLLLLPLQWVWPKLSEQVGGYASYLKTVGFALISRRLTLQDRGYQW